MQILGGFRLVRVLGSGRRAEVWLGHDGEETAAIKVFRPGIARESIDAEIEALGRASSPHLLALRELSSTPDGVPCLILDRLSVAGLGRIMAKRDLDAGEAVTALAPVALAIAELHRVGVAHGGIGQRSVLFDGTGAPVLGCFGAAALVGPFPDPPDLASLTVAEAADKNEILVDLEHLGELVSRGLLGVPGTANLNAWIANSDPRVDPLAWPLELADRLFEIAEPVAIRGLSLGGTENVSAGAWDPRLTHDAVPLRLAGKPHLHSPHDQQHAGDPEHRNDQNTTTTQRGAAGWGGVLSLPSSVETALSGWRDGVSPAIGRVRAGIGRVRKRVWVLAAGFLVATAAGSLLLAIAGGSPGEVSSAPSSTANTATTGGATIEGADISTQPGQDQALSDDPIEAAQILLERRADCLRQLSILCLDGVDQTRSSALDADSHAIRLAQQGAVVTDHVDYTAGAIQLLDRLGDSALLSIDLGKGSETQPVSLLLVRSETGWLIRDLVADSGSG